MIYEIFPYLILAFLVLFAFGVWCICRIGKRDEVIEVGFDEDSFHAEMQGYVHDLNKWNGAR